MELNELRLTEVTAQRKRYLEDQRQRDNRLANPGVLFGVEVELERFQDRDHNLDNVLANGWDEHQEGSLVNGREFVMYPPRNGDLALAAIDAFFDAGFRYDASDRTSIHIHVDMTDDTTVGQMRSILALTYMLEGPIYRMADENRKWGSYSCPLTDMNPERFIGLFAGKTKGELAKAMAGNYHEEKYYGCNVVSLRKHGTLEFRYFPCTTEKKVLLSWVNLCLELKTAGMKFADPSKLYAEVNNDDKLYAFLKEYMPKSHEALAPYLDVKDSHERILAVHAMSNDRNVTKAPHIGADKSPAIRRYLDAKANKKQKLPEPEQQNMPLLDVYELLQAQQARARRGEELLQYKQAVKKYAARVANPQARPQLVVDDNLF